MKSESCPGHYFSQLENYLYPNMHSGKFYLANWHMSVLFLLFNIQSINQILIYLMEHISEVWGQKYEVDFLKIWLVLLVSWRVLHKKRLQPQIFPAFECRIFSAMRRKYYRFFQYYFCFEYSERKKIVSWKQGLFSVLSITRILFFSMHLHFFRQTFYVYLTFLLCFCPFAQRIYLSVINWLFWRAVQSW